MKLSCSTEGCFCFVAAGVSRQLKISQKQILNWKFCADLKRVMDQVNFNQSPPITDEGEAEKL
jgi:hypothetical protein